MKFESSVFERAIHNATLREVPGNLTIAPTHEDRMSAKIHARNALHENEKVRRGKAINLAAKGVLVFSAALALLSLRELSKEDASTSIDKVLALSAVGVVGSASLLTFRHKLVNTKHEVGAVGHLTSVIVTTGLPEVDEDLPRNDMNAALYRFVQEIAFQEVAPEDNPYL